MARSSSPRLPVGWSKRWDEIHHRPYFLNHLERSSTWSDPRLSPPPAYEEDEEDLEVLLNQNKRKAHEEFIDNNDNKRLCCSSKEIFSPLLCEPVQGKLDEIFQKGLFERGDLDQKVLEKLSTFEPEVAYAYLLRLESVPPKQIKHPSAYFNGIMRDNRPEGAKLPKETPTPLLLTGVQGLIDNYCATGLITRSHYNQQFLESLSAMGEEDAIYLLEEDVMQNTIQETTPRPVAFITGRNENPRNKTPNYRSQNNSGNLPSSRTTGLLLHPGVQGKLDSLCASGALNRSDLDERLLETLSELPPPVAYDILHSCAQIDMSDVRNKSAFITTMIQNKKDRKEPVPRVDLSKAAQERLLHPDVQVVIDKLCHTRTVLRSEIDQVALDRLSRLSHEDCLEAVERFASSDFSTMKNKAAFLMGIISKLQR